MSESFTSKLNHYTAGFQDINKNNDKKHDGRIGEHGHHTQSRPQRNRPSVAHKKTSWINIKPKKSQQGASCSRAKRGKINFILKESNDSKRRKGKQQDTTIQT